MKLATTTEDFSKYYSDDISKVKELALAGFKYIDFSLFNKEVDYYMDSNWKDKVRELKKVADEEGVKFVQMHSPALFEGGVKDELYDYGIKSTIRSIEICKELEIPFTVVHGADNPKVNNFEQKLELNREFYKNFFSVMEDTGVMVLSENSPKRKRLDWWQPIYTGKQAKQLCEYINHPLFAFCWDTGHANMQGTQYQDILDLGNYLKAVHYNDNDGISDLHTLPFTQTLNNDEVISALIKIGFTGPLTFECPSGITNAKRKNAFELDNRLALPPIEVARQNEKLLYAIGKALLSAYNLFEE